MFSMGGPLDGHSVYEAIRLVGRGQRSFVQVARNRITGEVVAIKFIPRGWEAAHNKYIAREILNHQELSLSKHPHVVEFKEVFLTQRYLAEVLEYVEGETLQVFLEKVGGKVIEGLARFIFQQLIIALDFCHRKGKVNRDIKLSNILLSIAEGQLPLVKLCDFGFSKDTHRHSEPHSQVGTALFVAPEVMQNFSGGRYDGQAADVWACGVCLFIMLFGRHPYLRPEDSKLNEQQQMIKLFQRMMQNQLEFPPEQAGALSPECLDLLSRMLRTNPAERFTMGDIQRHVWFTTALPEGAGLMNDLFLAEEAVSLSPQSQSQIEQLVALASRLDDMPPTRVQLPSAAARMAAGAPPLPPQGVARPGAPPQQTHSAGGPLGHHLGHPGGTQVPVGTTSAGMVPVQGVGLGLGGGPLQQRGSVNMVGGSPAPYHGGAGPAYSDGMHPQQQQQQQPQYSGGGVSQQGPYSDGAVAQQQPVLFGHAGGQQQQQQQQQLGRAGLGAGGVSSVLGMIPDLDAMIMNMPETDLLQAATIDLRPHQLQQLQQQQLALQQQQQQQQQQQAAQDALSGGSAGGGGSGGSMGPPQSRLPPHMARPFVNSISSCAPGSVIMTGPGGLPFGGSSLLDPSTSSFLVSPSTMLPAGPSGMAGPGGVGLAPLAPPQAQGGGAAAGLGAAGARGGEQGGPQQPPTPPTPPAAGVVDVAPFLYEGNDDELPTIGSVSAVMPKFDWGSFNAPVLANNSDLQASQQYSASRFTRVARDALAKLSESKSSAAGSHVVSPDAVQQQLSTMGLPGGGSGVQQAGGSNGLSRLGMQS